MLSFDILNVAKQGRYTKCHYAECCGAEAMTSQSNICGLSSEPTRKVELKLSNLSKTFKVFTVFIWDYCNLILTGCMLHGNTTICVTYFRGRTNVIWIKGHGAQVEELHHIFTKQVDLI
jgi:hypothetical protein